VQPAGPGQHLVERGIRAGDGLLAQRQQRI
jgi:hypothetical protein